MPGIAALSVCAASVSQKVVPASVCALPIHSHQENRSRTSKSKTPGEIRPHSTKVKNKHEECQCLWGRERHLKIYIYSESARDQTAKLIRSSFNPCAAAFPQFPHLATYRLSTSAVAVKTPGWPAVTSPQAKALAARRKGSFDRLRQRCEPDSHTLPFVLTHTKSWTPQRGLLVFIKSIQDNEQGLQLSRMFFCYCDYLIKP